MDTPDSMVSGHIAAHDRDGGHLPDPNAIEVTDSLADSLSTRIRDACGPGEVGLNLGCVEVDSTCYSFPANARFSTDGSSASSSVAVSDCNARSVLDSAV
ncbi:MAG: hypothetical protein C0467_27880 [Planctomycetaceae bacterium]|nr:hypothetical protein [Planctomycetaceae bacterium]